MIRAEEQLEMRELVGAEMKRFIGPRTVNTLLVLTIVCVVGVVMLWNRVSAQDYMIEGLSRSVYTLNIAEEFQGSLDKNTAVMMLLAEAQGIDLSELEEVSGETDQ